MQPIRYAQSDDISIAYQVSGIGDTDIVIAPGFISHQEHEWENTHWARFKIQLGTMGRLICFDKRGTGLSDRHIPFPNLDERIDDIRAVMDAANSKRALLVGISEGGAMALLFAATYPERVSGLILLGAYADGTSLPGHQDLESMAESLRESWGTGAMLPSFAPTMAKDEAFHSWWARFERLSASPSSIIDLRRNNKLIDVSDILETIRTPVLVIHRTDDPRVPVELARKMAGALPNARLLEVEGTDHFVWLDDSGVVMDGIRNFMGKHQATVETDRVLSTVIFADIVGSTERASSIGDTSWNQLLQQFKDVSEQAIGQGRGRVIKWLGDGVLTIFDGPTRAIETGIRLTELADALDLQLRVGLHTGEVVLLSDGDISGIAVHAASRICDLAAPRQVLVSSTLRHLVTGSRLQFDEFGQHQLKGLEETVNIFSVLAQP